MVTKKPERRKRVTRQTRVSSSESSELSGTDSSDDNVVFIPVVHDDTTDLHDDANDMHADDVPLNDTLTESAVPVDDSVIADSELELSHTVNGDQSSVHEFSAHLDSFQADSGEEQLTLHLESEASDDSEDDAHGVDNSVSSGSPDSVDSPSPVARRSSRVRRCPTWITTGEFVT